MAETSRPTARWPGAAVEPGGGPEVPGVAPMAGGAC